MEHIYHEKQEGLLCGLHTVNNLLQSRYFTEFDLASLANQVDQQERSTMAEGGDSEEYRNFLKSKSQNMNDSGFFSIEVIIRALKVWNLDVINYNSHHDIAVRARQDPTTQNAYICNFKDHWFTIRKIGRQYFNLNSLLSYPELLSSSYISLFLAQLQNEGYSIFIITGTLPQCEADEILSNQTVTQVNKPQVVNLSDNVKMTTGESSSSLVAVEEDCVNKAIQESLMQSDQDEDKLLQRAITLSIKQSMQEATGKSNEAPVSLDDLTEEQLLEKAISMSLEKN